MNDTILAALRQHADGDVHVERLLDAVHAGVRRRRQRRLALVSGAAVALTLVTGTGLTAALSGRGSDPVAGPVPEVVYPRPPRVTGQPTVAGSPAALGSSPTLFHLDLASVAGASFLSWDARPGHEELGLKLTSGVEVVVEADRDPDRLRRVTGDPTTTVMIGGRPVGALATGSGHAVRWQPVPGVWVQVYTTGDLRTTVGIAERLRLDRVYRCAVPFRLRGLSAVTINKCSTDFTVEDGTGRWSAAGAAWFEVGTDEIEYQVSVDRTPDPVQVNETIAGRQVEVSHPTGGLLVPLAICYPYDGSTASFWAFGQDPGLLRSLVGAFEPVAGDDPARWPRTPLD